MLSLYKVTKRYGPQTVFSNFSLDIPSGARISLMGASGCGKTTVLRLLAGLEEPDAGQAKREGTISLVFQEDRLLNALTPMGNLRLVAGRGTSGWLENLLVRLGLEHSLGKSVSELSGGMKRRVAIARALAVNYDAILLDEPFRGLDPDARKSSAQVILEEAQGKTILLVTHDLAEAGLMGTDVVRL